MAFVQNTSSYSICYFPRKVLGGEEELTFAGGSGLGQGLM